MDALTLARLQFGFTVGFHFLFAPLSIGLSLILVIAEHRYYKSGRLTDKQAADFWLKLLVATVAIGVATGIPMEFSFGTNWSNYSRFVGDVFGFPLAAEGLLAFFLESTFIGVLIFGRKRVSRGFYYASAWLVLIGAHLSALWILIANSWQQTPAGYKIVNGKAELDNVWAAIINHSTVGRVLHTIFASWTIGAFFAAAICAYYILKGRHLDFAHRALPIALTVGLVSTVMMPIIGDIQARTVIDHQPAKLAAMEGVFHTDSDQPANIIGWVDESAQKVIGLKFPGGLSLLISGRTSQSVTGLNAFPKRDWPPLQTVFQSYHLMVSLGMLLILVALLGIYYAWRKRLAYHRWFLYLLLPVAILPWIATESGWVTAEVGRQPWVVYGLMRTSQAASPSVSATQIGLTLTLFVLLYALLFLAYVWVMVGIIRKGPQQGAAAPASERPGVPAPGRASSPGLTASGHGLSSGLEALGQTPAPGPGTLSPREVSR